MEIEVGEDNDEMLSDLVLPYRLRPNLRRRAARLYECLLISGLSAGDSYQVVFEVFSPPRVTAAMRTMPHLSLSGVSSFDLAADENGVRWDFTRAEDRERCRARVLLEKPSW